MRRAFLRSLMVIAGRKLVLEAAGARLPALLVLPLVDFLHQVLYARVAAARDFPLKFEFEGAIGVDRADVLLASRSVGGFQTPILDGPGRRKRLARDLKPLGFGCAVEELLPSGLSGAGQRQCE